MRLTKIRFSRLGTITTAGLAVSLATMAFLAGSGSAEDGGRGTARAVLVSARTAQLSPDPLTTACLFFNKVPQSGGAQITHRHQAGMVYALSGAVRLTIWQDGLAPSDPGSKSATHDLAPGSGAFLPNHWWHQHSNPAATSGNAWYFAAILDGAKCANLPAAIVHGDTFEVPQASSYSEKLIRTTVAPESGSELQQDRGVSETVVLDGSVRLSSGGSEGRADGDLRGEVTVGAGQGFFLGRDSAASISNPGTSDATLLSFEVTPREAD